MGRTSSRQGCMMLSTLAADVREIVHAHCTLCQQGRGSCLVEQLRELNDSIGGGDDGPSGTA
jgi:hypothetical protein